MNGTIAGLTGADTLPAAIRAAICAHVPQARSAPAVRSFQGRSNQVFRLDVPGGPVTCKVYDPAGATPLFPNRPRDEALALMALAGSGLAPQPLASGRAEGRAWLLYRWVDHDGPPPAPADVGAALRALHARPRPRLPAMTLHRAVRQADALLARLHPAEAARLAPLRPDPVPLPDVAPAFLHGDPVPGNLLSWAGGSVCLIDWQCPALGDPVFDLALYLSPAMQIVHAGRDLTVAERAAFWDGYGDSCRARFDALAPVLHWRMALYCAWRCQGGDVAYAAGLAAELERLERG